MGKEKENGQNENGHSKGPKGKKKGKTGGFQSMGLSYNILGGIMRLGYKVPTPVQRKALPPALAGKDLVCMARTGSGKTAAFLVPALQRLAEHHTAAGARGIILSPTRELAVQTMKFAKAIGKLTDLRVCLVVGGDSLEGQFEALARRPDLIIATPGRLMHMLQEVPEFHLNSVELLVFDEADRLFEMGFAEQLNEIIKQVPPERQTLLFSATMPAALAQFARAGLRDPDLIRLDTDTKISPNLGLSFFTVRSADKPAAFLWLVRELLPRQDATLVFVATKHHAEHLHALLAAINFESSVIYGAMDQESRNLSLEKFKRGKVKLLIVTDVAARGIDIPLLNNVVNYSFPCAPKLFVHRVGRAARQGRSGAAFNLVDPEELPHMVDLHLFLGRTPQNIYRPDGPPPESSEGGAQPTKVEQKGFDLKQMTPDMVYYGSFPQAVLDTETEFVRGLEARPGTQLKALAGVVANAMKQVRRTRADPSKTSIHRAKDIVRSEVHPLLVRHIPRGVRPEEMAARGSLLDALHGFRPRETVFEVKAHQQGGRKKNDDGGKLSAVMAALRRDHYSVKRRDRLKAEAEGGAAAAAAAEEEEEEGDERRGGGGGGSPEATPERRSRGPRGEGASWLPAEEGEEEGEGEGEEEGAGGGQGGAGPPPPAKRYLSRAERKRAKRKRKAGEEVDLPTAEPSGKNQSKKTKGQSDLAKELHQRTAFRDEENFIGYGGKAERSERENFVEGALQPKSDTKESEKGIMSLLEDSLLDINPDTAQEMHKKKQFMHWDARKKKYIKTTVQELAKQRGNSKLRTESGAIVNKKVVPTGELYQKWKSKTHKEVAGEGIEEEAADTGEGGARGRPGGRGRGGGKTAKVANAHAKEEVKGAAELRKERKKRKDLQLKNMPKKRRNKIMQRQKEKRKEFNSKGGKSVGKSALLVRR